MPGLVSTKVARRRPKDSFPKRKHPRNWGLLELQVRRKTLSIDAVPAAATATENIGKNAYPRGYGVSIAFAPQRRLPRLAGPGGLRVRAAT